MAGINPLTVYWPTYQNLKLDQTRIGCHAQTQTHKTRRQTNNRFSHSNIDAGASMSYWGGWKSPSFIMQTSFLLFRVYVKIILICVANIRKWVRTLYFFARYRMLASAVRPEMSVQIFQTHLKVTRCQYPFKVCCISNWISANWMKGMKSFEKVLKREKIQWYKLCFFICQFVRLITAWYSCLFQLELSQLNALGAQMTLCWLMSAR